jgi:hypothetical protein
VFTARYALSPYIKQMRFVLKALTVAPAESHGLVRFVERRNLVSARVPSNLNCTLHAADTSHVNKQFAPASTALAKNLH